MLHFESDKLDLEKGKNNFEFKKVYLEERKKVLEEKGCGEILGHV